MSILFVCWYLMGRARDGQASFRAMVITVRQVCRDTFEVQSYNNLILVIEPVSDSTFEQMRRDEKSDMDEISECLQIGLPCEPYRAKCRSVAHLNYRPIQTLEVKSLDFR